MLAPQYSWSIDRRMHVDDIASPEGGVHAPSQPPRSEGQPPAWPLLGGWQINPPTTVAAGVPHTQVQWLQGRGHSELQPLPPRAAMNGEPRVTQTDWAPVLTSFDWPASAAPMTGMALGWLPDVDTLGLTPITATAVATPMLRLSRCVTVTGRWPATGENAPGNGPRMPLASGQTALIQGVAIRLAPDEAPMAPATFSLLQQEGVLSLRWADAQGRSPAYQWLIRYCLM